MKQWLIKWLYNGLDDWAKWEVFHAIKCPSIDAVLLEQERQAATLFKRYESIIRC